MMPAKLLQSVPMQSIVNDDKNSELGQVCERTRTTMSLLRSD